MGLSKCLDFIASVLFGVGGVVEVGVWGFNRKVVLINGPFTGGQGPLLLAVQREYSGISGIA